MEVVRGRRVGGGVRFAGREAELVLGRSTRVPGKQTRSWKRQTDRGS